MASGNRFVAVSLGRFDLYNHARASLNKGDASDITISIEELGHSELCSKKRLEGGEEEWID